MAILMNGRDVNDQTLFKSLKSGALSPYQGYRWPVPNGKPGVVNRVTVSGRLPVLVNLALALAVAPSRMWPKFSDVVDGVRIPFPAVLTPVRVTVVQVPE